LRGLSLTGEVPLFAENRQSRAAPKERPKMRNIFVNGGSRWLVSE